MEQITVYYDEQKESCRRYAEFFNEYEGIKCKKMSVYQEESIVFESMLLTADFVQNHPVFFVQNQLIFLSARDFFQIPGGHFSTILSGVLIHMKL